MRLDRAARAPLTLVLMLSAVPVLAQNAGDAAPTTIRVAAPRFESTAGPSSPRGGAIEYSDWYGRRLTIHRAASYAMVPLFAAQFYTGTQLMNKGQEAPAWTRNVHGPLAGTVAGLFAVNTVTGGWNLWEGRSDPEDRLHRTAHGLLMMVADAGFAATGFLACEAEDPGCNRSRHRAVALGSMGVAAASFVVMLPPFRR